MRFPQNPKLPEYDLRSLTTGLQDRSMLQRIWTSNLAEEGMWYNNHNKESFEQEMESTNCVLATVHGHETLLKELQKEDLNNIYKLEFLNYNSIYW